AAATRPAMPNVRRVSTRVKPEQLLFLVVDVVVQTITRNQRAHLSLMGDVSASPAHLDCHQFEIIAISLSNRGVPHCDRTRIDCSLLIGGARWIKRGAEGRRQKG